MKQKIWSALAGVMIVAMVLSACASNAATNASGSQGTTLPAASVQLNGAGATFPLPVYTEWIYAYQYVNPSVTINYQGIGSGGGKKAIIDNTVDFAGSDSLVTDDEYTAGKDLQMYPMVAGAVVPVYNIDGITSTIVLDRDTLANIYLAKIAKWNDPAIAKLNPDLASKLPDKAITVVHRSDGSGTRTQSVLALRLSGRRIKRAPVWVVRATRASLLRCKTPPIPSATSSFNMPWPTTSPLPR